MDEIFGVPMDGIMVVLVALLAFCLLTVAWVAWRRPVIFKLGVRNIPRRRAQTVLIVVGLMLSTLIISAALGTGDTVNHSVTAEVYRVLGPLDEVVVASQDPEADVDPGNAPAFDAGVVATLDRAFAGDERVDGILPMLSAQVPVQNETRRQSEPSVFVVGVDPDPARLEPFGGIRGPDGRSIDLAALPADGVVLTENGAEELAAEVGDRLTIYYGNAPVTLTVAGIAENRFVAGQLDLGDGVQGMVLPLARLQEITGQLEQVSMVAVSNRGGTRDSLGGAEALAADLRAAVAGVPGQPLGVDELKREIIDESESIAQLFSGLFLVLGLFSVAAGILLIVLIFTMLAAERRPEMGMTRAVGGQRRQLIQQFIAEGSGYAILAGLVGSALGVIASFGIAYGMRAIFGEFFPIEPNVTARSMIVAYCLGVVITFLAVVGSSWKISRLNIVAAVRDIPDVSSPRRKRSTLVWAALLMVAGVLLSVSGQNATSEPLFTIGMSLWPFGLALLARYFGVPSRPVFTAVGVWLLAFWLLPPGLFEDLFGDLDGDIEMFFVSGIFMVIGATIVIVQNLDALLWAVSRVGGLFRGALPAVRTAIAYPGAAKGRTGMTIAMFSLIVFSLVMIATMNQNFSNLFLGDEANAGWDVRADVADANPIAGDDLPAALAAQGVDTGGFRATGVVTSPDPDSRLREAGGEWGDYPVSGMDASFIRDSDLMFEARAEGYADDAAIVDALLNEPNVAVIDAFALEADEFGGEPDSFALDSVSTTDEVFVAPTVEIQDPDGQPVPVRVIGIIDSRIGSLFGLFANRSTTDPIYPSVAFTSYWIAVEDPDRADTIAKEVEAALLPNGAEATSVRDELEEAQSQNSGFLYLIQGFMGLGLFVGVAAVGVIAFRNVVERRQQIGVLRALGFQRSLVSLSFLIETAFIVGVGVIAGTALGIVLARNLFTSDDVGSSGADFSVPWPIIGVILLATVVVALLMTWVPSRQAARIAPAEALRYE